MGGAAPFGYRGSKIAHFISLKSTPTWFATSQTLL